MSKYPILDVYSREMIAKPRETLQTLCDYLSDEFVKSTIKILYRLKQSVLDKYKREEEWIQG